MSILLFVLTWSKWPDVDWRNWMLFDGIFIWSEIMLGLLCIGYTWAIGGNCLIMIGTIQWLDIMYVVYWWRFCSFITECFTACTMGVVSKGLSANDASLSSSEVIMRDHNIIPYHWKIKGIWQPPSCTDVTIMPKILLNIDHEQGPCAR